MIKKKVKKVPEVLVSIYKGVVEIVGKPEGVQVVIRDYDMADDGKFSEEIYAPETKIGL